MDVNARIKWKPGMELTATAMSMLDENLDFRQLAAMRTVLAGRHGLIPGAPFSCNGTFVRNNFEIANLRCMALLSSGWMVDVDESVSITIPMLNNSTYYFAVGLSENLLDFEHKDVEFLRPEYTFQILSSEDLKVTQNLPLIRFSIKDGTFNIDPGYIPPCLMVMSSEKFEQYRIKITDRLEAIGNHANIPSDDGSKLAISYYLHHLGNDNPLIEVKTYITLLENLNRELRYYILEPHKSEVGDEPLMTYDLNDVQLYLEWTIKQLDKVKLILDNNPVEEKKPDFEELKAILRRELMAELQPLLEDKIHSEVEALRNDIQQQVSEALKDFLSGEFRRKLYEELSVDLSDSLYQKLYDALYRALYSALYREEEVVTDDFTPMI